MWEIMVIVTWCRNWKLLTIDNKKYLLVDKQHEYNFMIPFTHHLFTFSCPTRTYVRVATEKFKLKIHVLSEFLVLWNCVFNNELFFVLFKKSSLLFFFCISGEVSLGRLGLVVVLRWRIFYTLVMCRNKHCR